MQILDIYMHIGVAWGVLYALHAGKALWQDDEDITPFTRFVIFPVVLLSKIVVHSMAWPISVMAFITRKKDWI